MSDLNNIYEIAALMVLPGYEGAPTPRILRLRRRSRLVEEDRLVIDSVVYGSPLELIVSVWGTAWPVLKELPALLTGSETVWDIFLDQEHTRARERRARAEGVELDNIQKRVEIAGKMWELEQREASTTICGQDHGQIPVTTASEPAAVGPGLQLIQAAQERFQEALGSQIESNV